jgi:hypothetical protein
VDVYLLHLAIDLMPLHFAGVMSDVIEHMDIGTGKYLLETEPDQMSNDLAIGKGVVDGTIDGREILFPLR